MPPRTNATRIPDQEWETQKDTLHKLYIDENRSLNEIVDYMQTKEQFLAVKRQYVHRFQKWGWKKYHSSVSERSAPSIDPSVRGDVDKDEGDEPERAPIEFVQDPEAHRETTSAEDKAVLEGSSQHLRSVSSSSHDLLALRHQHRAYSPPALPQFLQDQLVMTPSKPLPNDLIGRAQVLKQGKVMQPPKKSEQESLAQAQAGNSTARVRKSTEYYAEGDSEDASNPHTAKKLKTGHQKLPCPFRKRNPQRFNVREHGNCALHSYADFALLKRHIKNFHQENSLLFSCIRCKTTFASQRELNDHQTRLEPCRLVLDDGSRDPEDGITVEISHALQARKLGENVNTWESLWALLFPDDNTVPSSVFEPVIESYELETFLLTHTDYIARELGSGLRAHGLAVDAQADIINLLRPALLQLSQVHRTIKREEILAQIDKK